MIQWTDAHNHLQDARLGETAPVIASMKRAGVSRCIVNATREEDWQAVADLATEDPAFIIPTFGIHPWQAHTAADGWQERLAALLERFPRSSVGECGLDQWIAQPAMEVQRPIFIDQLALARDLDRPVTIHCLKAWGTLFDVFASTAPPRRFLMHSYGGSIETARRLIPLGAYFSFSGYFLHPRKSSVLDVFRKLPRERILLETDAPDMTPPAATLTHRLPDNLNHPANLSAIGHALANALAMQPEELADQTSRNSQACFGI